MTTELIILAATAILAVVAVVAAIVAVRVVRRAVRVPTANSTATPTSTDAKPIGAESYSTVLVPTRGAVVPTPPKQPDTPPKQPDAQVLSGRVVVTPTRRQVVDATMGKPLVRLSVLSYGIAHALRPESRDHIRGLMRREFRSRRRQRKRAARHAARIEPSFSSQELSAMNSTEGWLGELPPSATRTSEVNDR